MVNKTITVRFGKCTTPLVINYPRVIKHPVWSKSVETRTRIGPLRSDRVNKHPIW